MPSNYPEFNLYEREAWHSYKGIRHRFQEREKRTYIHLNICVNGKQVELLLQLLLL